MRNEVFGRQETEGRADGRIAWRIGQRSPHVGDRRFAQSINRLDNLPLAPPQVVRIDHVPTLYD